MALRSSLYRMTERAVGGDLADKLVAIRATGESYEGISRMLATEYGVEVTGQTIRTWLNQLATPDQAAS